MKNFKLFNQSLGTVGGSNQTGETLTRENRIGLMSYLRRTLMLLFAILVMSIANIGMAWGAETEIIKSVLSGSNGSTQTVTGSIGGTSAVNNLSSSSPYKLNSDGAYVSITLASGYFQATDFLELDGSKAMQVYYGTPTSGTLLLTTTGPTDGKIRVKLKGLPANQNTIYVYRSSSTYNGTLTYMSVKRPDPLPTTGTGTVTYSLISNSANVEGEATVSTITADDASFTTSTLTVTSGNNKSGYSGQIKGFTAISEYNASYYVALSFSVASGYTFEPSAVSLTIFANSCTPNAKVVISDGETTIESNTLTCSSSADAAITFAAGTFTAGKKFSGDVTIKVYFWGASGDKRAYIKSPLTITGTVASAAACGETAQAALTLSSNSGTICGTGSTTFTVSGGSGTGALSVATSDPSKATASIDGSTVTVTGVAAGSATITVTKACDATYAEKTATYSATVAAAPSAAAGVDKTTEPGNGVALAATAAADGCTGAWTIVSGPNTSTAQLSSTSSATATFTPTVAGTYTLRWTVTNTSTTCSAYDEMTVSAAVCSISSCGNATITYAINGGSSGDHATGGTDLISSATADNTTALGASTTIGYTGISMSSLAKKAAAAISACYPSKPNMSGKIDVYNGAAYSSSNYLQFAFTVKTGYTFTPCDIEFTVQPVDVATNFRWEVTDGTNSYGYGTATDVPKGSDGGASVLTGLTSTAEMEAGTYYIRLYPYVNAASKTFRMGANVILKGTTAAAAPSCTAPSSVTISGTNKYLAGQTISLTAAPVGGSGATTTYQWQKEINSVWTNLSNSGNISGATTNNLQINPCDHNNSGQYRCIVTKGGSCSTTSSAYGVHVFSIYGKYYSGEYSHNEITWTSGTTGTATIHLNASSTYLFKVWSNDGYYYGNGSNNYIIQPVNWDCGTGNDEMRLLTGPEGDYTFTVNIEHGLDGSPYVNVQVGYPSVSHPSTGYMYITKWWDHCYVHYWEGTNNALSPWGYDPEISSDRYVEICGTNYWYFPVIDTYNKLIAKDAAGDPSNTTGDQVSTDHGGMYITHSGSWGWHDFATYTITYAANGGGGSMTATSGICPDANQAITSNAFTAPSGCASFSHWTANVNVKVGGNTITAGDPIANGATIQNINSNITLTAVWKLATPTITDNGDNTFSISGSMAGSSYKYSIDGSAPSLTYSSAVDFSAGEANITAKAIAHKDGYVDSDVASQACTYHAAVTCTGDPTALVSGTLYKAQDMKSACFNTVDGDFVYGLSANDKFYITGTTNSDNSSTGTVEIKGQSKTIDAIAFDSIAWLKGSGSTTHRSIKFVTGGAGTLTVYGRTGKSAGNVQIKPSASDAVNVITASGSGSQDISGTYDVSAAGTYYLLSNGSSAAVYGIKFVAAVACTAAPTVTAGSNSAVTSTTATVSCASGISSLGTGGCTITSYGFVIGTSANPEIGGSGVTQQEVGTSYTVTGTAFNKNLTGLTASTTYYVRPYATNGYGTGYGTQTSFTTSAPPVLHDVTFSLTNVVYSSGDNEGTDAATEGVEFSTIFAASSGYSLPGTITVTIGGVEQTVGTGYTWAQGTGTLTIPAAKVTGDIVVTIVGEEIEGDGCEELVHTEAATAATLTTTVGTATLTNPSSQAANDKAIKLNSSGYIELSPKAGKSFAAGDSLIIVMWNQASSAKTTGYRIAGTDYTASMPSKVNTTFRRKLIAADIVSSKVKIERESDNGSNAYFVSAIIKHCEDLPSCTTPTLPSLSDQTVCPGSDIAAWDATPSNAAAISAASEDVAYSWKKKGSDAELATTASFDLGSSATEGMAGTYVVTVTVSKTGYISKSASAEVDLTVTPATEEPSVTQSPAKVYPNDDVTLTATCGSAGTITWAWFTCNSDGTGEAVITGKTTATCAITAPASAGTYYYKVKATGDDTNACGTASHIHTLTVTAASECENYFWFTYADDATSNGVINNRSSFFSGAPTGSSNSGTYKFTLDGTEYTATKNTGSKSISISFTVPEGSTADFVMNGKSSSSNTVTLSHSGGLLSYDICASGNYDAYSQTGLTAGTWTLTAGSNWTLAALAVHVCHASSCTDAVPEIAAVNNTVCSGTELSITATGYETSPTSIQWQKLNSSTSAWDNISGATEATYSVASAAAEHAGSYRCVVTKGCARTSNTVTITIQSAPVFGDVPSSVTVMQTIALSISTVEASDAASYKWYKSANNTWDESDPEIGTSKNLIKAYADEATGTPSYYVFCRATNSCGTETSSAIAVNVTAYVAEDCAEKGNEGEAEFDFENTSMSSGSYNNETAWSGNSNSKYLTYIAQTGKNFATAKVTIATSGGSSAAYAVYNGSSWTYYNITGMSSSWQEKSIDLPANTTKFQIGRRLDDKGTSSGTFYLHEACFTYTETCTATAITVSGTGSETHTIGSSFTEPEFTVKHGGTTFDPQPEITYTSSNEDIATVDDDGTVNFQGMAGSVTITAAYAGDATYCASEGSYTITVSCSDGAPEIFAASSVDLSGCNSSVVLDAKQSGGSAFADGTYQWYRDGEAISGATSASYTAVQAGVYTVERTGTGGCTNLSSNSATVTSETVEPEIEHLAPFQYYHVDKDYSDQMKMRHLFTVKGSAAYGSTGKNFKMELSKNGAAATDVTTSNAFSVVKSADNTVDTVMIDLNKLNGKYAEDDELVLTCKAVDCEGNVSSTYKDEITIHVIDATPTMALILNGKGSVVGGDFLEDYEPKNLQEQTGSKTWSGEWPMYTDLKTEYNVTPVNGYAPFNKLNYEPFDIIFLTDFPKASKSDAAATILDDMAALCDYRPLFSFKTHMVHKSPSKWAAKGFTTSPTENKGDGRTYLNIVCYAHPMFEDIKTGDEVYTDASDGSQLVYKMLSETGYEKSKGMQGFEIDAAENFVTIGLTHYNASVVTAAGVATWTPGDGDRMLVSSAERQANPEARMILLSLNAGAHSKLTEKGRAVVMKSLEYLIQTSGGLIEPADCSYTFDNAAGDNNWNTAGNWGPRHNAVPGAFTSARIAAPAVVDIAHAVAMEVRIVEGGSITIPAGKGLEVKSTIRHMDGSEISPTEISELTLEASSSSNGTLIFNNNTGDTKATVWAYSKGFISGGVKNYQYIGTPFNELNALYNYYGSWIYSWGVKKNGNWGWVAVKNGGPMNAWTGYCISQESPTYYETSGTMTATGTVDIAVPAGENMVVGNSWTAPIDIASLTSDDLEGLVGNIYFFNTGVDKTGTGDAAGGDRYAGGTYVTVPVNAAPYSGDDHIPSMQGFFVKNTGGSDGMLHLDYERHVRGTTRASIIGGALHAPARRAALDSNEPEVLKIKVSGENYDDKLLLLAREDFSTGFDNGWDGDKWDGNESALYLYTTDSEGTENSVSAIPQLEGTVIGFRAGEDEAYTLHFNYLNGAETLYLYDTEKNLYTEIKSGNAYWFMTNDKEKHERFIITRSNGQEIPTGIESTSDSSQKGKAKKLLIGDKMYIMVDGMLYDATGKAVK